jgi:hypothetical protein
MARFDNVLNLLNVRPFYVLEFAIRMIRHGLRVFGR